MSEFRQGLGGAVVRRTMSTLGAKCAPKMGHQEPWLVQHQEMALLYDAEAEESYCSEGVCSVGGDEGLGGDVGGELGAGGG
jgi:hypothetical protein